MRGLWTNCRGKRQALYLSLALPSGLFIHILPDFFPPRSTRAILVLNFPPTFAVPIVRKFHALLGKSKLKMASPHTEGLQGFSQATLEKKLQNLNSTLQNIQLMAQWAIHYRKHAKTITSVWYKELQKGQKPNRNLTPNTAPSAVIALSGSALRFASSFAAVLYSVSSTADSNRKLTLLYLANDIVQNSRKKGTEFKIEFTRVLPRAFHIVSK